MQSEVDGEQDCFPISYSRCSGGESRDALGNCVPPNCSDPVRCPSMNGTWNPAIGLCDCVVDDPIEVCERVFVLIYFSARNISGYTQSRWLLDTQAALVFPVQFACVRCG